VEFRGRNMDTNDDNVINVTNSEIIKKILYSLILVAKSKTSKDYAWGIIKNLLIDMSYDYSFLQYIHIGNLDNINDNIDDISVIIDFDSIEPKKIGETIQKIINLFRERLGRKAGYFFLSEFKEVLGNHYYEIIKKMGVDLRLIDLHEEIYGYGQESYEIKDKYNSNIAYLEKRK
jgi:hypothetical protein